MPEQEDVELQPTHLWQNRLVLLIVGAIVISLFLVSVALALYASSGTAQLDLSRPGYESVRAQASESTSDSFSAFPSTGDITKEALTTFRTSYVEQSQNITSVDAFSGAAISDEALEIGSESN